VSERPWDTLCRLLEEAGAKMTFSINCHSGIAHLLGADHQCGCWRCRNERGDEVTEESEARAALDSKRAQELSREKMREFFEGRKG